MHLSVLVNVSFVDGAKHNSEICEKENLMQCKTLFSLQQVSLQFYSAAHHNVFFMFFFLMGIV